MDRSPRGMVRTDFEHREIERPVLPSDVLEFWGQPGVGREESLATLGLDDPRRPERRVAIVGSTAGEMLRGRCRKPDTCDLRALVPVELDDPIGIDAEFLQALAYAERGDDRHALDGQRLDRRTTEVTIVIVR